MRVWDDNEIRLTSTKVRLKYTVLKKFSCYCPFIWLWVGFIHACNLYLYKIVSGQNQQLHILVFSRSAAAYKLELRRNAHIFFRMTKFRENMPVLKISFSQIKRFPHFLRNYSIFDLNSNKYIWLVCRCRMHISGLSRLIFAQRTFPHLFPADWRTSFERN